MSTRERLLHLAIAAAAAFVLMTLFGDYVSVITADLENALQLAPAE